MSSPHSGGQDGRAAARGDGRPRGGATWNRVARIAGLAAVGGLAATWLNVSGAMRGLTAEPAPARQAPAPAVVVSDPLPAGLGAGAARLRERLRAAPRPVETERNPFRLPAAEPRGAAPPAARPGGGGTAFEFGGGSPRPGPGVTLIGVATNDTPDGPDRTAILLRRGEVVLARPGQALGGGWTLDAVEEGGATFRDAAGAVRRMALP